VTNLEPGATATVEWASSLLGLRTNSWAGLGNVLANANGTIHVSVPMYYRVCGVSATNASPQIQSSLPALAVGEASSANFGVRLTARPCGLIAGSEQNGT
jgi:hypothetical protein